MNTLFPGYSCTHFTFSGINQPGESEKGLKKSDNMIMEELS
jgi:hypothetical protein